MSRGRHARKPAARTARSWPQRLLIGLGIVVTITLLTAAAGVGYVYWRLGQIRVFDDVTVDAVEAPELPRNYLLVGSDVRSETDGDFGQTVGERSDTVILVRYDPENQQAYMVSLPRDLWVELPDGGHDRINAAYANGRQVLIDAIRQNFGIDINHYVEVDMVGFGQLVDAIGGVNMYFDAQMRDGLSGLDIDSTGCVTLDGATALAFARARHLEYRTPGGSWHTDPTGDLGRITRQQLFLRTVMKQAMAKNLLNPIRVNSLMGIALDSLAFDPELGQREELLQLADDARGFDLANLHSFTLPVEGFRTSGGASVVRMVEAEARPILNIFRGVDADQVELADVSVNVLNGSGVSGQAREVTDALSIVGFAAGVPSSADGTYEHTTILFPTGWDAAADLLARHLTSGAEVHEDGSLGPGELVLITGTDFTTVMEQAAPSNAASASTTVPEDVTTTTGSIAGGITTTTLLPPEATSTTAVGVVPGQPPPGVVCG
jgi:LCP family protein required for cell wall assembly